MGALWICGGCGIIEVVGWHIIETQDDCRDVGQSHVAVHCSCLVFYDDDDDNMIKTMIHPWNHFLFVLRLS